MRLRFGLRFEFVKESRSLWKTPGEKTVQMRQIHFSS